MQAPNASFLLSTPYAQAIYASVCDLPILDYHCHLSPRDIAENRSFSGLGQLWLEGDHYKWRVMRAAGVPERLITGDAPFDEKLRAFAAVMPTLAGNPLYHFSQLELARFFGITTPLTPGTVDAIAAEADEQIRNMRARDFIRNSGVRALVTTDSPTDALGYHAALKQQFEVPVLPAFRPDEYLYVERPGFTGALKKLGEAVQRPIATYDDLKEGLKRRLDFFVQMGAVAADHGLDTVPYHPGHAALAPRVFEKALSSLPLTAEEIDAFKCDLLCVLAAQYARLGIVCELHFGCQRNANPALFGALGPDVGVDAVRSETHAQNLYPLLGEWVGTGLPRTLLFSLNPADNGMLNTVAAAFPKEGQRAWVQQGSAWWFNDHLYGIREQLKAYASTLPLGTFAGMLTDSRSLLSYARHDYFRRILSDYLGDMVAHGEYPTDRLDDLIAIAKAVSYTNTKEYFKL